MIKKSILFLFVIFIVYNSALVIVSPPDRSSKAQNQWQMNVIKAQKFIYEKYDSRFVFVGTSLTFRLLDSALPKGSYNLAMAGTATIEGLNIIKRSNAKPVAVFVETNFLMNRPDNKLSDCLFQPIMYSLRNWIPALRERNQPINYYSAISFYMKKTVKNFYSFFHPLKNGDDSPQNKAKQTFQTTPTDRHKIVERMLKINLEALDKRPSEKETENQIEAIKDYINYFNKNGIKVFFFEVPFHEKLYHTRYYDWEKIHLESAFPPDTYAYIKYPFINSIETTDGVHLTKSSALTYCIYLSKQIDDILGKYH